MMLRFCTMVTVSTTPTVEIVPAMVTIANMWTFVIIVKNNQQYLLSW